MKKTRIKQLEERIKYLEEELAYLRAEKTMKFRRPLNVCNFCKVVNCRQIHFLN